MTIAPPEKVSTRKALKTAATDRQVLAMLVLGLASGLPYVAVGGTLNAWLTTVDVKPVAIGLLSWALLAYAFKFMWAAALQSRKTPFGLKLGPRRFLMSVLLALITLALLALSFSNPPNNLGYIGLISVIIAVLSASFDIVLAAWRIEAARDDTHLDILSTVEQFGYRIASLMGGFVALIVADHIGWKLTFLSGTALMALTLIGVFIAKPSQTEQQHQASSNNTLRQGQHLSSLQKLIGTLLIMFGWGIGFYMIADFMHGALTDPENHSARSFIRYQGPWIIGVTVILLGVVSAVLLWINKSQNKVEGLSKGDLAPFFEILYQAIVEPMMELIGRLKWSVILVLAVVLSYRFTDLIWGGFAYPFYLGENYGATNLLFADLALNANFTDTALAVLQLDHLYSAFGLDIRMARLTTVIFAENIAVGLASAASIAYLSSIVNKDYAAVQYALLVSLVMLLGVLGRPTIGAIIEEEGFAQAFIICAILGGVASFLALVEWIRLARQSEP